MEVTNKYGSYAAQSSVANSRATGNNVAKNRVRDNRMAGDSAVDNSVAGSAKREESQKASELSEALRMPQTHRQESLRNYAKRLAKLAPSVEVKVGNTFPSARKGKTLTINPGLLNKMQNDPEQEKETKEMIRGVEMLTKWLDGLYKATGRTLVYRHSYIDENGKYYSFSRVDNTKSRVMSEKLRKERWKNSEKLIRVTRKKAAKKRKELQEKRHK